MSTNEKVPTTILFLLFETKRMSAISAEKFGAAAPHFKEVQEVTNQEASQGMLHSRHTDLSL